MSVLEQIPDGELRAAAFLALRRLRAEKGVLTADDLQAGFEFGGERIPFANSRRGIWKPKRMQRLLSIKTVHPKPGGKPAHPSRTRGSRFTLLMERQIIKTLLPLSGLKRHTLAARTGFKTLEAFNLLPR